jgi:hypothetical protein
VQDIRDEINSPIWCELGYRLVLDPLGELVDSYQHMGETAWRHCEGPNHIKAPASKGPGWRYGDEAVGWNMRLLAEELTVLASAHQILRVRYCGGPQETGPACFPHQRPRSCVIATDTFMYLPEYVIAIFLRDALHENA